MQYVHSVVLASGTVLLAWAAVRLTKTPKSHPDHGARRDMVSLLLLLIVGVIGDAIRLRFPERSQGFMIASVVLLPIGGAAIVMLARMLRAFRRSNAPVDSRETAGGGGRGARE